MKKDRVKHLELIQNIITRMNRNSFQSKNWAIITTSAIISISLTQNDYSMLLITLIPITLLWALDSYYLQQERKFRALYDIVRNEESIIEKFTMDTSPFTTKKFRIINAACSKTIFPIYLSMAVVVLTLFFLLQKSGAN